MSFASYSRVARRGRCSAVCVRVGSPFADHRGKGNFGSIVGGAGGKREERNLSGGSRRSESDAIALAAGNPAAAQPRSVPCLVPGADPSPASGG